jgi:hypothetical protein
MRFPEVPYIRNLLPDRWPAGDPALHFAVGPFGDVDPTTTKQLILDHRDEAAMKRYFDINFAKRPAEELYDLRRDPDQIKNLATDLALAATKAKLAARVDAWMQETKDPRVEGRKRRDSRASGLHGAELARCHARIPAEVPREGALITPACFDRDVG